MEKKDQFKIWKPTDKEKDIVDFCYKEVDDMVEARNQTYRQFNDRTLIEFIDDSEKRVQGYVPSREAQGKEDWQSNVFNQTTRNKLKAIVASVASTPPKTPILAKSIFTGGYDIRRSEYMEGLVQHARMKNNPEVNIFWEAWQGAAQGTIIKYNGYLKSIQKRKFIKSYDPETGNIEFDEHDVIVSDECVDTFVDLNEFFIKDFYIQDVQDQPAVAWIRYVDKSTAEMELGKYKNWKYVQSKAECQNYKSETTTFFLDKYSQRTDDDEYEIVKYYNKSQDKYIILCNGILLLDAPMLWGRIQKYYPFAKTIFEPFSSRSFFYGNSLPNANMDVQDTINSLWNMGLDKTRRSMNPPLIVGTRNKDLLEQENETLGMEDTIYVDDVGQIQYQVIPGITNSEMAMIKWVGQQFDMGTVDANQQGVANRGVTAREIVIANENAKKLKGIFFTFLTDLWVQKTRLTITNILMHYTLPRIEKIVGPDGAEQVKETYKTFYINNFETPNGQKGVLGIQIVGSPEELPTRQQLDIDEEVMKLKGVNLRKTAITSTFFDEFDYEPEVTTDSIFQQDRAENQAVFQEKLKIMMTAFPQIFQQNQMVLFEDFARVYNEKAERYNLEQSPVASPMEAMVGQEQ